MPLVQAAPVTPPPPSRPRRFVAWLGHPDGQGLVRAFIAAWLIGMLIAMQFVSTAAGEEQLAAAARTLIVVVVAFYFGQRVAAARRTAAPPAATVPPADEAPVAPDSEPETPRVDPGGVTAEEVNEVRVNLATAIAAAAAVLRIVENIRRRTEGSEAATPDDEAEEETTDA